MHFAFKLTTKNINSLICEMVAIIPDVTCRVEPHTIDNNRFDQNKLKFWFVKTVSVQFVLKKKDADD
jgi:hypothetical protein